MNLFDNLSDFEVPDNLAAIITTLVIMMIPIIAILTRHQQKMAYILNQGQGQGNNNSDRALTQLAAEVQELRTLVSQQTVTLDNLAESNRQLASRLEQRVSTNS